MGDITPVFAIVHFRLREASQRATRDPAGDECPGSEADRFATSLGGGGKILATHKSPLGEGVKR